MAEHGLITISGLPCSGSTTLGRLLAKEFNREIIEAGVRYRQEAERLGQYEEDTWYIEDDRLIAIDQEMLEYVRTHQKIVWEGRLSGWFAREISSAIRIWCWADLEIRALRYTGRENIALSNATRRILERENNDRRLFARLYGASCIIEDTDIYNISIDTGRKTVEETFQQITRATKAFF